MARMQSKFIYHYHHVDIDVVLTFTKAFNVPVLVENIVTRTVGVHGDFGQHSFILYGRQANHGVLLCKHFYFYISILFYICI